MTVQDWLGKDNEIGIDIWCRKYQFEDETFEEWLDRVSGGNKAVRDLIVNKKFKINKAVVMAGYFADRGLPLMSSQIPVRVYTGDKDGCKNPHMYRALAQELNISDADNILLEGAGHGDTPGRALFRDGLDGDANGCSDLLEYLFG